MNGRYSLFVLGLCFLLQACVVGQPPKDLLALTDAQMKIRSFQSRFFSEIMF